LVVIEFLILAIFREKLLDENLLFFNILAFQLSEREKED
jgi:hypothetical protein